MCYHAESHRGPLGDRGGHTSELALVWDKAARVFTTSPSNEWLRAEFTVPGTGCVCGQRKSGTRRTVLQPRDTGAGFWACTEMRKGPEGYAWDVDGIRRTGSSIWSLIVPVLVFIATSELFFFFF